MAKSQMTGIIKLGPCIFCKHVKTLYQWPLISLPALESPHSGGAGKNFFHYIIQFSVLQLYIHVQLVFNTSSINLTYVYHISVTLGFSYTLVGVMFLLPYLTGCASTPWMSQLETCDFGIVFSQDFVCVCVCDGWVMMMVAG